MAKGYEPEQIKQQLVDLLKESKSGLSGVEIAEKLGINRVTISKYLNIFSAEGLIRQKSVGNVTLWSVEEGTEKFQFPDDYYKVRTKFIENLTDGSENQAYNIIKNCIHSDAKIPLLMSEVLLPAIESVQKSYQEGKIGNSEEKLQNNIISHSIQIAKLIPVEEDSKKNVILLSADSQSVLIAEAASTSFRSEGWKVYSLGDMSSTIDVLFDLDLQKLLNKVWKQKSGIMVVVIFSETEESSKFFVGAVNSVKEKIGRKLHLALCGKTGKKTDIKADLISDSPETILQWSETVYESSQK